MACSGQDMLKNWEKEGLEGVEGYIKTFLEGWNYVIFFNSKVKLYTGLSYNYYDTIFNYQTALCMYEGLQFKTTVKR